MPEILRKNVVQSELLRSIPGDLYSSLRTVIIGPEAQLRRYDNATEKALISLGEYIPATDTTYDWPNRSASSLLDEDSVEVFIDNALLQYHQDLIGAGTTITPVASYANRIIMSGSAGFKANGTSYPRIAALYDRDVAVNDVVHLQDGANELWTYVKEVIADKVGASIGAAAASLDNMPTQPVNYPGAAPTVNASFTTGGNLATGVYNIRYSFYGAFGETWASAAQSFTLASAGDVPQVTIPALPAGCTAAKIYLSPVGGDANSCTLYASGVAPTTYNLTAVYSPGGSTFIPQFSQTAGVDNSVDVSAVSYASYDGLLTGDITETYTITCIQASTGGNATTARLQVTSSSGRDNQTSVTPSAFSSATAIGTRGLTMTWANGGSGDFALGQTWQIQVRQAFTVPSVASAGSYTGTNTLTYIVSVTRGNPFASGVKPQITWTTSTGEDVATGSVNVTTSGGAVSIGSLGVTIAFTGTALRKGDVYTIAVTGPTAGAYRTLLLGHNLTTGLQASSDMQLTMYLKKNIEVPAARLSDPNTPNWVATDGDIVINAAIDAYDTSFTDNGVEFPVLVKGGTVYVQYRAWLSRYAGKLKTISTINDVTSQIGDITVLSPDNTMGYALFAATEISPGLPVHYICIADPSDVTEWEDALKSLEGMKNIRNIVPLTRDEAVWDLVRAHVLARSAVDVGGEYRTCWLSPVAQTDIALVNAALSLDEEQVNATLVDDPETSGTQYTYLTVTTANSEFVTNGVQPGDIVRYLYTVNSEGEIVYTEFVIEDVVNEDTLRLTSGHSVGVGTAQRVEVWRRLSAKQAAENLVASYPAVDSDARFFYVWPDRYTDVNGDEVEGYNLAVKQAVLTSTIAPQQGTKFLEVAGVTAMPRATDFFNNAQRNILGAGGFYVMTYDEEQGAAYTLMPHSSDPSEIATREESLTRQDDGVRYAIFNVVERYFGKSNITTETLTHLQSEIDATAKRLLSETLIDRIGAIARDIQVFSVREAVIGADQVVVQATITRGVPLNTVAITVVG